MVFSYFPFATQPEILLRGIKDEIYISELHKNLLKLVERFNFFGISGVQNVANFQPEFLALAKLLYYLPTSGTGMQTLGEEYCDVVQVVSKRVNDEVVNLKDQKKHVSVPIRTRLIWICIHTLLPYIYDRSKVGWEKMFNSYDQSQREQQMRALIRSRSTNPSGTLSDPLHQYHTSAFNLTIKRFLLVGRQFLKNVDKIISLSSQLLSSIENKFPSSFNISMTSISSTVLAIHLSLFYISGKYYEISKRLVGIRYIFSRKIEKPSVHFVMLGYFIVIRLLVTALVRAYKILKASLKHLPKSKEILVEKKRIKHVVKGNVGNTTFKSSTAKKKCILCLGDLLDTALTPCGHIFCWECVISWCQNKPECPLCRQETYPQDLRCVYNF